MAKAKTHKTKTRKIMRDLGTYKQEFEPVIEIYAELKEQYDFLTEKFIQEGFRFSEETQTGTKKAPIVTTLESLRKDILSYARDLGLTPQGLLKFDENAFAQQKYSKLSQLFGGLMEDD